MALGIEKIIQEWLAKSSHEKLPGAGKPLDLDEYFRWPEDLRLAYSVLKNSGYIPEEVHLLREIGELEAQVAACEDPVLRKDLTRRLQERQVELNLKLETKRRRR
ncbi:MAG TPA: DUF1992 domain-containing protein [Chthoniobacterales bacterium]